MTTKPQTIFPGIWTRSKANTRFEFALPSSLGPCLVELVAQYPHIVYLAYSLWRKLLVLSCKGASRSAYAEEASLGMLRTVSCFIPSDFRNLSLPWSHHGKLLPASVLDDGDRGGLLRFVENLINEEQTDVLRCLIVDFSYQVNEVPCLYIAVGTGNLTLIKLLLDAGAKTNLARVYINIPNKKVLNLLLEHGELDVTAPCSDYPNYPHDAKAEPPLFAMAGQDSENHAAALTVTTLLVEHGKADIHYQGEYYTDTKLTLLHRAALAGNLALVQYLVGLGLDPSARSSAGRSPVDMGWMGEHQGGSEVVTYLNVLVYRRRMKRNRGNE